MSGANPDDDKPRRRRAGGGDTVGGSAGTSRKVWRGRTGKPASNQGSREVIIRVTGRTKSVRSLGAQFRYFSRNGDLPAEHSNGRTLVGMPALHALRDSWAMDNAVLARHPSCTTQSVCVVLSMPAGTDVRTVRDAVHAWAHKHITPTTEWLAVVHTDRGHPHVHCAIRAVQDGGRRVSASPAEMQTWRETFAGELRARGIEAEATPQWEKLRRLMSRADERQRPSHERRPPAPPTVPELPGLGL